MVNLQACPTISIAWANPFPEIDVPTQENTIMGKISRHTDLVIFHQDFLLLSPALSIAELKAYDILC